MFNLAHLLTARTAGREYLECRHCGFQAERRATRCPFCDATEIASYPADCFT